jgi:hypothetical protein
MEGIGYIDRDEFEEAILCQHGHDDLVPGFSVIIEQRKTASVGLNEYFGGIVERAAGMIPEHRRRGHAKALLDVWRAQSRVVRGRDEGTHLATAPVEMSRRLRLLPRN